MKKQPYMEFVESNSWFRESPRKRKSYISKVSRLANSIQKDVDQGPAQMLLTPEEQRTIRSASEVLKKIKLTLEDAKYHAIHVNEYREYEVVKVHRHKYTKLIDERLPIDKENFVDVCKATMVMIYFKTLNILFVERYVMLIERRITRGQHTPEELVNLLIFKYTEERDRLAYKFYSKDKESVYYDELIQTIDIPDQETDEVLKPYLSFFTKLSDALTSPPLLSDKT